MGYLYHITLRGESLYVDLALYFVLLAVGFLLPRALWPLCEWPGTDKAALLLTALLGGLIVWFTFPAGHGAVRRPGRCGAHLPHHPGLVSN